MCQLYVFFVFAFAHPPRTGPDPPHRTTLPQKSATRTRSTLFKIFCHVPSDLYDFISASERTRARVRQLRTARRRFNAHILPDIIPLKVYAFRWRTEGGQTNGQRTTNARTRKTGEDLPHRPSPIHPPAPRTHNEN